MREIVFDRTGKTVDDVIKSKIEEDKAIKPILSAQCESWWRCKVQQIDNGMIDTFTCKKKVCTDVILQRPYSLDDLQAAIKKHCTGAQSDSQYCDDCEWRGTNAAAELMGEPTAIPHTEPLEAGTIVPDAVQDIEPIE